MSYIIGFIAVKQYLKIYVLCDIFKIYVCEVIVGENLFSHKVIVKMVVWVWISIVIDNKIRLPNVCIEWLNVQWRTYYIYIEL